MTDFRILRKINLFSTFSDALLKDLYQAGTIRFVSRDGFLFQEGDGEDAAFFVVSGRLNALRINLEGREQVITYLSTGQVCNLPSVFTGKPAVSSVVALEDSQVFLIGSFEFQQILIKSPQLSVAVMKELSQKLQYFNQLAYDLSLRSVRARLATFLLDNRDETKDWTQNTIAARIGTVREVVSRTMRSFVKEGLIKIERHAIIILNQESLENIADQ